MPNPEHTELSFSSTLTQAKISPHETHAMYDLSLAPPLFEKTEAVARYQAFLEGGYRAIGGICLVDPAEFDSNLERVLSFHEKGRLHLQAGALLGPHVIILPGKEPILNRGVRIFERDNDLR